MQRLMNKRGLAILLSLLTLLLAVAGCGSGDAPAPDEPAPTSAPQGQLEFELPVPAATQIPAAPAIQPPGDEGAADQESEASAESEVLLAALAQNRIIVHTAHMSLEVDDVALTIDGITALAADLHGWVVSSDRFQAQRVYRYACRLSLEEALQRLDAMALKTVSRAVTSEDVTDEYVDNQSRLASLRATEQRVLSFLDRAQDVEEALLVQKELAVCSCGLRKLRAD